MNHGISDSDFWDDDENLNKFPNEEKLQKMMNDAVETSLLKYGIIQHHTSNVSQFVGMEEFARLINRKNTPNN